ncbi:MAG TPA: tetratricopeptide repeat protein, partial [Deinococcales bacterium]|nr:tetratricopeptide repeat protein [Deinococcales bacterium]
MNRIVAITLVGLALTGSAAAQTTNPGSNSGSATSTPSRTCASYYLPYGKLEYANAQYTAAFSMFRYCTLLEAKNTEALYLLARTEVQLELYTAAIEHITDVLKIDPRNARAYVVMAQAYTEQWRRASDRRPYAGNLDKGLGVLEDAQKVAEKNGDKAAIWNQMGLIYKYRSEFDKSLAAFRQASRFSPDDSTILFNLGALQVNLNQMADSIATLRSAVDADPTDYTTRAFLAKVLLAHGDLSDAKSQATQAYR